MQEYEDTRDVARRVVDGLRGITDPERRADVLLTVRAEVNDEINLALAAIAYELWQQGQTLAEIGLVISLDRHTVATWLDRYCERTGKRRDQRRVYVVAGSGAAIN